MPLVYHPLAAAVLEAYGYDSSGSEGETSRNLTFLSLLEEGTPITLVDGVEGQTQEVVERWKEAGCPYTAVPPVHPEVLALAQLFRVLARNDALDMYINTFDAEEGEQEELLRIMTRWGRSDYALFGEGEPEGGTISRVELLLGGGGDG